MYNMKINHSIIGIVTIALSLTSLKSDAQLAKEKIKLVDSAINYYYKRGLFNGTVLLAQKGSVVYQKAVGTNNAINGKPLSIESSFNLASISKQFMATMIMMLQEKGKLQYDDLVAKHLPTFPYNNITIRNLLNHTSGLSEYEILAIQKNNTLDTLNNDKMLALFAQYKPDLKFEPGTKWEYSNTAYVILGSIIVKEAGMPVESFFQQQIVQPLKLQNTYIHYLNMKTTEAPHPTRVFGMDRVNGQFVSNDLIRLDGVFGDGNVYSSAIDLLKWDQALYTNKLISADNLKQAFTRVTLKDGTKHDYGFGWVINQKDSIVSHTGGWVGFRNLIERHLENKLTAIVLSSGNNGSIMKVISGIIKGENPKFPVTQLINNVKLIDGTGSPAMDAEVRMIDNKIYEVGKLSAFENETVIDGKGLTLAPGFIDSHSHHFGDLEKHPEAIPTNNQGITTIVIGQDGGSYPMDTISDFIKKKSIAVNVASYTGHASLREETMGEKDVLRMSTQEEQTKMQAILKSEMEKGSLGLSTGLEYEQAFYSSKEEVLGLAKVVSKNNGRYISHIRSEDVNLDEAIEEIIEIGKTANIPVQISHIKIAKKSNWNQSTAFINRIQKARAEGVNITADVYPYNFWNSTLRVLFPNRDYTSLESATFATEQLFDPTQSYLVHYAPITSYEGKTISAIAQERNESTPQTLMNLIAIASDFDNKNPDFKGTTQAIAAKSMGDFDVANFIAWPYANICSDGNAGGHPRGYGAFTRVLGKYVREDKVMPLETAIFKMTGMSAEHLGIKNRGIIAAGNYADLVLFNPATVKDNATVQNSRALSTGIEMVWINGQLTYKNQQATGNYPGMLIKKQ